MRNLILSMMLLLTATFSFATENKMSDTPSKVKLTTSLGEIIIQLNHEKEPI